MKPRLLLFCLSIVSWTFQLHADELPETPVHTAGMERQGGYFDVFWDEAKGRVFLNIDRFGEDFLFLTALESGLGSNPVGLDRGQLGDSVVCRWRLLGRKVYLEQQNLKFRAEGARGAERRAVADSFAPSILWGGDIVAKAGTSRLVDVTSLVVSDRHGISLSLKGAGQGDYSLSSDRSLPLAESFASFPNNTELPAMLTFTSGSAGSQVRAVLPRPEAVLSASSESVYDCAGNSRRLAGAAWQAWKRSTIPISSTGTPIVAFSCAASAGPLWK